MAVITPTNIQGVQGKVAVNRLTSTAADTFTYISGRQQLMEFFNTTGSPITVTIIGASATTVSPAGLGGTVSVASGYAIPVAANGGEIVNLDTISGYLVGVTSVTGGVGLSTALYQ